MARDQDERPIALEERAQAGDQRLFSPSVARNRGPIGEALRRLLPERAIVLEIGSGTGEHAAAIAAAMPGLDWRPSDPDPASRASIAAWIAAEGLANVRAPLDLDVRSPDWGVDGPLDAVMSVNMIHIAPWEAALGLLAGAGRLLRPGGQLILYGPFARGGAHTAPSNAAFDESLRRRDPRWGVRDLDDVAAAGAPHGLTLREVIDMPANNLIAAFARA
ncbi:MAG: class I SAM-dependent methyltransferase [Caulobacterales bacterium]|nr:class I SAM-dependent methyltransferase [Caulobacterales bacterium]